MVDRNELRLKRIIKELELVRGRHTELISVYIPAGYNLDKIKSHLSKEQGTAANIKSKQTRNRVIAALEKILQELKLYKKTPKNGLVVFAGNISKTEGKTNLKVWAIEPQQPLELRLYRCDQLFILDPLKDMLEPSHVYGLVVIDSREATIGLLKGKLIDVISSSSSFVPGKFKAGGQSAARFARVREGLLLSFLKGVGLKATEAFRKIKNLKGVIVGGPGPVKNDFIDILPNEIKNKILGIKDIAYTDESGLNELVDASKDIILEKELQEEKEVMDRFLERLGKGKLAVYGGKETDAALKMGALDTLLISEKMDPKKIEDYLEVAKKYDTHFVVISDKTREGIQLVELGGIAGILRYQIDL